MARRSYFHEGEDNPNSRLSNAEVVKIRESEKDGISVMALSKYYGVSVSLIYKVLSGERWGHVKRGE